MDPQLTELPLRDIHAGYEPLWWPPAPGWWVLAVIALVALAILAMRLLKRYRRWQYRQALMAEMDGLLAQFHASQDGARLVAETSTLLRRLIVHAGGRSKAASLTGEAWSRLLAEVSTDGELQDACNRLATAPYQPNASGPETADASIDVGDLQRLVTLWVDRVSREASHV